MELLNLEGHLRIGLTPSDQIALSLHFEDQAAADRSWLVAQADQGNAPVSYLLARVLQSENDTEADDDDELEENAKHQQIFHHLKRAAKASHSMAQFHLAECYLNGRGVKQDFTKAVELYRRLADHGISQAQIALGGCYENGEGVDQEYNTAIEWYSKAADQGNRDWLCKHFMALCLHHGFGTTQDRMKAACVFEQLANDGHSDSQLRIGKYLHWGLGVLEDRITAFEWYSKSADQGNSYGQWMTGVCYYWGYGVTKDFAKAFEWYRRSAEQGNRYGQDSIGRCYKHGEGVPEDIDTAVLWYHKSADQGHKNAIERLKELGEWH
ncbi:uncharacterized protein BJ171DRAFT_433874 [Polychytrium aggregatum]|uniref:uncharacterized protein n=1 Tax=Polychytrium aggregatum TaxID=110093 RepID=UPI0022FDB158|nr:uncharacterized protein BJ171DRAFT_433874 [Polychytrium aggregatum]KAI9190723.1 hypothetical protein BJ171DRAFT_433874 [Polychytrium aggregatum]